MRPQHNLTHRALKAAPPWGEGDGQGFAIPVTLCGLCHHNRPSYITRCCGALQSWACWRRGGGGDLCPSSCGLQWTPRCRAFPPPTPLGPKATPLTSAAAATTAGAAARQATRAPVQAPAPAPNKPCTPDTHLNIAAAVPRTGRPWKGR